MIERLNTYADTGKIINKINEIIDFVNDTYLMKVKDGQTVFAGGDLVVDTDVCIDNSVSVLNAVDGVSLVGNAKCPHCGESYYTELYSDSTSVYYPPIYKNGVNINPDRNQITTHCRCLNCDKEFSI